MAYSAVSQPSPLPRRQPGTPSSTEAVQRTRVAPKLIRQEPSAYGATPRSKLTTRRSDGRRPWRSDLLAFTQFPYDRGCRLAWGKWDNDHSATAASNFGGPND